MANEIQLQCVTQTSVRTLTKAQKRWRLAYLSIYFSNTMLSIIKVPKKLTQFPIATNQSELTNLVKNKDLEVLGKLNGVSGVAESLQTDLENGINGKDVERRKKVFGSNSYDNPPHKGFFYFVWERGFNFTIAVLLACATLSVVFGVKEKGKKEGWYDGVTIFVAIFSIVTVSAVIKFRKEQQFDRLSKKLRHDIKIDVVRDGKREKISIFEVVVGEVVFINIGDQIPADGLIVNGNALLVDESGVTGESEFVNIDAIKNPFLMAGSKVVVGHGQMLVISVGMNTDWGKTMRTGSITSDSDKQTPLQYRVRKIASSIGKAGIAIDSLLVAVLVIRYFVVNKKCENRGHENNGRGKGTIASGILFDPFIRKFVEAVTTVVVAIPEGLPVAVTLAIAYSMKKMMADGITVKTLSACEKIGSTRVICTGKTGILTEGEMKVTKFWIGLDLIEDDPCKVVDANVLEVYHQGLGLTPANCSPTENAIFSWAVSKLGFDIDKPKQDSVILHVETFDSEKKWSGVSIRKTNDNTLHVHRKGAAELVLEMCSNYYKKTGIINPMTDDEKERFRKIIKGMAASSLRCIAFVHKLKHDDNGKTLDEEGFTLLGIIGMKNPCRKAVKEAIKTCRMAGVDVKMITGDNIFTAKALATEIGILEAGPHVSNNGEVIEGEEFRNYTEQERIQNVDRIRVMARSSPFDKLLMVQCMRKKGHVVAVTGHHTSDAPALKEANIGLSMGVQATEVAKEASDIVISDDGFCSIVLGLNFGRCLYSNVQKFIQFQLPANVAALIVNFINIASAGGVPITAIQLLWVNLIMVTFGALALALEKPTKQLMRKPPVGKTSPLITNVMWRNLSAQCLFQTAVLFTFQFKGRSIFDVNERVNGIMVFNTFVLCQVFNPFNSRKMEKRNVFRGLHKNLPFLGIIAGAVVIQVVMLELVSRAEHMEKLNKVQWGICVATAAFSWLIGWVVKWRGSIWRIDGGWWMMMMSGHAQPTTSPTLADQV